MHRAITLVLIATGLVSAEQACFFQIRFDHGGFWLERDKEGPRTRELDIPVDVSNVTKVEMRAQFSMNWDDDMGVKFNDGSYVYFPSGPRPATRMEMVEIPVGDIRSGANTVTYYCKHTAGQYHTDMYELRLYCDPNNPVTGRGDNTPPELSFQAPQSKSLGETVTLEATVSDNDNIAKVEYWALVDFFPLRDPKTPKWRQWHQVAGSTEAPFQATWETRRYPDQDNIELTAIAYDGSGYATVSESISGFRFERPFSTRRYYSEDAAEAVNSSGGEQVSWFRVGERPEEQSITLSMEEIVDIDKATHVSIGYHFWMMDAWWEEHIGTVSVNGHAAEDIRIRLEYPWGSFALTETDPSHWNARDNELTFTCASPNRSGYFLSTPAAVVYVTTPGENTETLREVIPPNRAGSVPVVSGQVGYYSISGRKIPPRRLHAPATGKRIVVSSPARNGEVGVGRADVRVW